MPRIVEHARIETATSRVKLKRGKRHYQSLITGKAHIGYRREADAPHGRWFIRRNLGGEKYQIIPIGAADVQKGVEADGATVLNFEQAKAIATDLLSKGFEKIPKGTLTVRKACAKYIEYLAAQGKQTLETERRFAALVLPELGNVLVGELTSEGLRKWHWGMVGRPALLRSKRGATARNTKPTPEDDEAIRKRKVTANRILSMVKAALNLAYDEIGRAHV